jgi:hypothetical protein
MLKQQAISMATQKRASIARACFSIIHHNSILEPELYISTQSAHFKGLYAGSLGRIVALAVSAPLPLKHGVVVINGVRCNHNLR